MNTIQDNSRFIDLTFEEEGIKRSLCKEYIRTIEKDLESNAVFLATAEKEGVSLNHWEFGTINNPTLPYPDLETFYNDIKALLNGVTAPYYIYPTMIASSLDQSGVNTELLLNITPDKDGKIYVVVVASGATAPTQQEIINGTGSGGSGEVFATNSAIVGETNNQITVTGLLAATAYDLYAVAATSDDGYYGQPFVLSQTTIA